MSPTRPASDSASHTHRRAFTLVELIVVMAILAILLTLAVAVSTRVIESNREKLTFSHFHIIEAALDAFAHENPLSAWRSNARYEANYGPYPPTANLVFLAADDGIANVHLRERLLGRRGSSETSLEPFLLNWRPGEAQPEIQEVDHELDSSKALYFFLTNFSPAARALINSLPDDQLTNADNAAVVFAPGDPRNIQLLEIRDPWGKPILYINDRRDDFVNAPDGTRGSQQPDGQPDNPLVALNEGRPLLISHGSDGWLIPGDPDAPETPPADAWKDNLFNVDTDRLNPQFREQILSRPETYNLDLD